MKFTGMNKHPEVLTSWGEIEIGENEEIVIIVRTHDTKEWLKTLSEKKPISFFMPGTLKIVWDYRNTEKKLKKQLEECSREEAKTK